MRLILVLVVMVGILSSLSEKVKAAGYYYDGSCAKVKIALDKSQFSYGTGQLIAKDADFRYLADCRTPDGAINGCLLEVKDHRQFYVGLGSVIYYVDEPNGKKTLRNVITISPDLSDLDRNPDYPNEELVTEEDGLAYSSFIIQKEYWNSPISANWRLRNIFWNKVSGELYIRDEFLNTFFKPQFDSFPPVSRSIPKYICTPRF